VNAAGTYSVTVGSSGCSSTSAITTVTINSNPSATANGNATPICSGGTLSFTSTGGNSYAWSGPNNYSSSSQNPTITNATTIANGTYTVTVTDLNGCSSTATTTVSINPLPTINIVGGNSICLGQSITLSATGASNYSWNTGATTNSITVNPTVGTSYTVTGTDANGCVNTQTQTVSVNNAPIANAGNDISICSGNGTILTASGGTSYLWNTGETTASISVNPTNITTYYVTVSNGTCSSIDSVIVNVNNSPIASVSPDITIVQGTSTTLTATGGGSYSWSNGETGNAITVNPEQTTDYCVTVTNGTCSDTACVRVSVDVECGELFIPNAFSPNGDGANDAFRIKVNTMCVTNVQLFIYNRWGEKVFEATTADGACNSGWDGTHKGKALDNAVFVYYLNITLSNSTEEIKEKGNVSLIR
jgi:gliding motility-associated-like protein